MRRWIWIYLALLAGYYFGHWDAVHGREAGFKLGARMREYIRQAKG